MREIQIDTSTYPKSVDRSLGDGDTTCLLHRQWQWTMANYVPHMPKCSICGGVCDPRLDAHHLCVARQKRSLPTTKLDNTPKCGCAHCVKTNIIKH